MRRRALRPSFVVTFALGAAAIASGCGGKDSGNNVDAGSVDGSADCPAEQPAQDTPCDLPSSVSCTYGPCADAPNQSAVCQGGKWSLFFPSGCNPPVPIYEDGGHD